MYVRFPHAAIWQEDPATPSPQPLAKPRPRVRTLWATTPLQTRLGRCVAVSLVGDSLLRVCLQRGMQRDWLRVEDVLTPEQAGRWARIGFAPR